MNSSIDHNPAGDASANRGASTLAGRLQAGVALNLLGTSFNQGSTFVVNVAVANLLGRESFGHYTIILATVATMASLAQLSMGYTATKHVAEFRATSREKTSRILGLCASISCVAALTAAFALAAASNWLAGTVLAAPTIGRELQVSAVAVLFTVVNGYLAGALAGLESYRALARSGVASGTVYAVLCTGLAWRFGLIGAIAGAVISALVQTILLSTALRVEAARCGLRVTHRDIWQERGIVTSFAVPASLTGLITLPAIWAGSAILARQPGGFDQLALFGVANNFRVMVLFVPNVLNNVAMSLLNNQRRSSAAGYKQVFWMNAVSTVVLAAGTAGLILLFSPQLLRLFGPEFERGWTPLAILLPAAVLEAIAMAAYQTVVSHGRLWPSLSFISLPRDGSLVLLAALLVPVYGAAGLAAAHLCGWVLALVGTGGLAWRLGLARRGVESSAAQPENTVHAAR